MADVAASDRDLASIHEARTLARRAKHAQSALAELSQEQIDAIVDAMAAAATDHAEAAARHAVEETGYGVVADKIQKNLFASREVHRFIRPLKTVGVIRRNEARKIVEIAERERLWAMPLHPYTQILMAAVPVLDPKIARERKKIIPRDELPSPLNPPGGCRFHTRCPYAQPKCRDEEPPLRPLQGRQSVACHLVTEQADGSIAYPTMAAEAAPKNDVRGAPA